MNVLKNKNAVITGASDGMGLAIAKAFAKQGANICLIARNETKLLQVKEQLIIYGTEVNTITGDISSLDTLQYVSKEVLRLYPKVDILVNNAGIGRFIPFAEMDLQAFEMHLNLNVRTPYFLSQYLLESLIESKGNIINITSYFSDRMLPGRATTAYSLTKGALNSFTKSLAFEIGVKGVRVNAIAPGSVRTSQFLGNMEKLTAEGRAKFDEMVSTIYPLGKIGDGEDIAQAAVYLASDNARWVTGSILKIDGGLTTN